MMILLLFLQKQNLLLSLELRTEDVWKKYNHFIEVCEALNQFGTLVFWCFVFVVIIHRAHKEIQGDECRPRPSRRSWLSFPWLSPIRNFGLWNFGL